jgi:hypothetical protein
MTATDRGSLQASLEAIFKAERSMRELMKKVERAPEALDEIEKAIGPIASQRSEDEQGMRLVCLIRILRNITAPKAIDLLIDLLGNDNEEARVAAGMSLEDIAYDRLAEVRKGVERAVKRLPDGHHALRELPFVLLSSSDGDAHKVLKPFLDLRDPEAVAVAIEALVENGNPEAIGLLGRFKDDKRVVELDDESTGESSSFSIGELAADATDALREIEKAMAGPAGT